MSEGNEPLTCELRILVDRQHAQYSPLVCHPGGTPQNSFNLRKKRFPSLKVSISRSRVQNKVVFEGGWMDGWMDGLGHGRGWWWKERERRVSQMTRIGYV